MLIRGSCHCGNVAFELDWRPEPTVIPARACTCAFCRKHGGVWTTCANGRLTVRVKEPALASIYSFETRTADFHICVRCGVVALATSRIEGRDYAVVNVNTFDGIEPSLLARQEVTFDGESTGDRLARRRRNWIGDVEFVRPD